MKQAFNSLNLPKPIADYFQADKSDGDADSRRFESFTTNPLSVAAPWPAGPSRWSWMTAFSVDIPGPGRLN